MAKIVSMSSGAIDPIAQSKRVFWRPTNTATVLKVGQPVCYHSDSIYDHKGRTGDPTHLGLTIHTYAEGAQDKTARLFCVEEPLTANLMSFAGIVKALGPKAGADGDMIEIFIPNGAVLPCWIDASVTLDVTVLGIRNAEADFSYPGVSLGIAKETIDRTVPGLCWVKVDPNMFVYQNGLATTGLTGHVANTIKNTYMNTSGTACGLLLQTLCTGILAAGHNEWSLLAYLGVTGNVTSEDPGFSRAVLAQLVLGGTINSSQYEAYALHAQITGTVTNTLMNRACAGAFEYALSENPDTGDSCVIFLRAAGDEDIVSYVHMYGDGEHAVNIWDFEGCGGLSTSHCIKKMSDNGMWTNTGRWCRIPILIDGVTYYIMAGETPA